MLRMPLQHTALRRSTLGRHSSTSHADLRAQESRVAAALQATESLAKAAVTLTEHEQAGGEELTQLMRGVAMRLDVASPASSAAQQCVRVQSDVAEPAFGWGGAKRGMTGVVRGISEAGGTCLIDFPELGGAFWRSKLNEVEVVEPEMTNQPTDDSDEGAVHRHVAEEKEEEHEDDDLSNRLAADHAENQAAIFAAKKEKEEQDQEEREEAEKERYWQGSAEGSSANKVKNAGVASD
ncbi:hypothetical protein FOA52_013772 [Chlamydomonas sp. UWO 241]|nr:hypothetical protein FOA52_013772 [Chlamydomonas sp. UWO 241]